MKLLAPNQAQDLRGQELTREILRAKEIEQVVKEANARLAQSEASFSEMVARHLKEWAEEEDAHNKRKAEMEEEIADLEAKKQRALVPIELLNREAEEKLQEAHGLFLKAKEREELNEGLTEKLEDKLDEVGERETNLKREESRLALEKEGVNSQAESVKDGAVRLSKEIQDFALKREVAEKDIDERKTALSLWETSLIAREEKIKRDVEANSEWDKRLHDERGTLDRAWKELEGKKGS